MQLEGEDLGGMSAEQMQAVIHDLHVHQIELEMQNEQLRLSQEDLEAARERFVELYDFAPVGYLTLNKEGLIVQANLTSVSMLGVERSRLVNVSFSRFVSSDDQEAYYHCWRKVFQSAGTHSCELRLRPASAEMFHGRLEAVRGIEGGAVVCRMTLSDITRQKRSEEQLRESERRRLKHESEEWKRLALEAGELGAWDQDVPTGRITCSAHACEMLDFPANTVFTWESVVSRVHPEDRAAFLREVEKSMDPAGFRRCDVVFRILLHRGSIRWLRFVAQTFFEGSALPRAARRTGVLADITRLKEAEEVVRSRAKELEGLVRERTGRLEEAIGELEHFSYTLVHDLRAPLRSVAGFSGLLLDSCGELSPANRKLLERSIMAVKRMDQLILDALNYNKIVRQHLPLDPVDCAALLEDVLDSYPQFQEARACICVNGVIPVVLGNTALLTQCFSNLLTNALKFVPNGTAPRVNISAQHLDNRVRIWIEDNGIGIREENHETIFKIFQRLNRDYEGTGIGLALVKKAVERMRGTVGFESQGQGSRFWLELEKAPAVGS